MQLRLLIVLVFAVSSLCSSSSVPPPGQLLPADTFALFSVPDWEAAATQVKQSPQGRLWQDPAMKPLRDKLLQQLHQDFAAPLQGGFGFKLSDFASLAGGQLTLALTQNGWGKERGASPGFLLLVDTQKEVLLKTRLDELKKQWLEAGHTLETNKIAELEFATLSINAEPGLKGRQLTVGQRDALLLVSNLPGTIEHVLNRLKTGKGATLADEPLYRNHHATLTNDELAFAWVNFAPIHRSIAEQIRAVGDIGGNLLAVSPEKMLAASGLPSLKAVAARLTLNSEGAHAEMFLHAPASNRQGIFKLLTLESKDAAPGELAPIDAVKFSRWRINGPQAWTTMETTLANVSPQLSGLLKLVFESAGKDTDPNFNLADTLAGNLGDDFISWSKRTQNAAEAQPAQSLLLIGSPNPDQLVQGLRAITSILGLIVDEPTLTEREFQGRKIYSVEFPASPDSLNPAASRSLSFSAVGKHAVLSWDLSLLQDHIRQGEAADKLLRQKPGLAEAAQKVGGMATGFFGYSNQAEAVRDWLRVVRDKHAALEKLQLSPLAGHGLLDQIDPALLPSYEQISKYFNFMVYTLSSNEDGLSWKFYVPNAPAAKE
jgi:hypothetical protein